MDEVVELRSRLREALREVEELKARVPREPFDQRCADRLADEVAVLVKRGVIDSRSPAADALLDYRNPPSTPRSDRLAELETKCRAAEAGFEEYRMRLAGALTVAEGHRLDVQSDPSTVDYVRNCPTIRACVRLRRDHDRIAVKLRVLREAGERALGGMPQDMATDLRVALRSEVVEQALQQSASAFPALGTTCSVCHTPQYATPGGPCCDQGHGGAPAEETP